MKDVRTHPVLDNRRDPPMNFSAQTDNQHWISGKFTPLLT